MPIEERKIEGKSILFVSYSNAITAEKMIDIFDQVADYLLNQKETRLILTDFTNSYFTPVFMNHLQKKKDAISPLVKKSAFLGMTDPKKIILKGLDCGNHQAFDSEKEAIAFLLAD